MLTIINIMFLFSCFSKKTPSTIKINLNKRFSFIPTTKPPITTPPLSNDKQNVINQLSKIEYKDTKIFYHNITYCKCIKVYDGDTITIATSIDNLLSSPIYRFSVRLMGIDCAELKTTNENEHIHAIRSRDALREKILGKIIRIEVIQRPEKWGRILAKVFLDDEDIGQWMLNNNYAIPYFGKTKIKPLNWL